MSDIQESKSTFLLLFYHGLKLSKRNVHKEGRGHCKHFS